MGTACHLAREKLAYIMGSGRILLAYEYGLNGNKFRPTDIAGKTMEYRYMMTDLL